MYKNAITKQPVKYTKRENKSRKLDEKLSFAEKPIDFDESGIY